MHVAVLVHAVDGEIVAADHKVGVVAGVIDADLVELFLGHILKALHALVKAEAERQMAGGILIEERIVEEQAGLVDRRLLRHERALAEIVAALVHADDLLENILSLFGLDRAVDALSERGSEDLLGRHVGIVDNALHRRIASGVELGRRDEADLEIRAVRGMVAQLAEMEIVQILAARLEIAVVLFPIGDGVLAVGAGGVENVLPELRRRAC